MLPGCRADLQDERQRIRYLDYDGGDDLNFRQLYSGSSGNLYEVVAENGKRLIIDPGVTWKKLIKALDYKLDNIEGCFVTHEHKDHSRAVCECWAAGLEICSTAETFEGMDIDSHRINILKDKDLIRFPSFEAYAFAIEHDVPTLGFIIREKSSSEYLLFAIDTKTIVQKFPYPFSIIALECAYDAAELTKRVEAGEVNETYARRLLTSHMERQITHKYLRECVNREKLRELHLLHLSSGNIDKRALAKEFQEEFCCDVIVKYHKGGKDAV